ncbi:methanethiol oxidase-like [Uranotaenia lowii]|uniref:methanethiol oxidase-like n=1 Tax=Uranotaenia lowii TaxID=190385 RepID=UPI002478C1DD|nr:methanethiol oxidase-like [Uranotaenia lowii]
MQQSKCYCGPGYATPLDAVRDGPREKLLYVVTVQPDLDEPHGDYLSTVDVDPESSTYCQVIHRTFTNSKGNELHHSGWNTCSSCHFVGDESKAPKRDRLILPCLTSDRIFVVDVATNPRAPTVHKVIEPDVLKNANVTAPHTSHCLPNGNIMISIMGDADGKAKGDFVEFDKNFNFVGTWTKGDKVAMCGYDFWYQPFFNVMVASEWGAPRLFRRGYHPSDIEDPTQYGRRLNFYKWNERELFQTIDLGEEGMTPLEIRFLHNPKENQGYVGCTLYSNVYRFYKDENSDKYLTEKVIDCPAKKVSVDGKEPEFVNGMMTDILISLDDRFLYFSNWMHGDIRQYDITDRRNPKLTGQVWLGGSILSDSKTKVLEDKELTKQPDPTLIEGRRLLGGPQMLQLSLDGKRLYVSSSLFSPWDKQFYPDMVKAGGTIALIDIDTVNGGMKINESFLVDFGNEPYGPSLPHEMRYPGGDCTSDIWIVNE